MERSVGQKLIGAFVVGGLIGVVAQAIMMVMAMVLPVKDLAAPAMLMVLGLIGMALVITGNYQKLNEIGGFGAGIMFCGLVDAVAGAFVGGSMEEGGNASGGYKAVAKFALGMLGTLVLVGTLVGVLCAHMPGVLAAMEPPTDPGMIIFLYAFLMGGLISIIGEALLDFTPIPLPAVIMGNGLVGVLLAVLGQSTMLEGLTGGGFCATIVDAGAGAVLGGATIVLAGTPMRTIILVAVMVIVVIMGIICGNILLNRAKSHQA